MTPKTLKFRAFESYVEEQFIDFSALSENGLFLINGETGAGKTAILDAMTYALYGETSGGSRGDVRCLHASADGISTEVEFVFELKGTEYKFTRSIKTRERGGKTTILTEQNALLYDGESFVPFESNPTKSKVSAKATELLGLTLDQFRQVIILPQGQFEQFLTSESGEKEQILSTLFNADKFSRISEILHNKSKENISKLNTEKEIINSLLTNEEFDTVDDLSQFLLEYSEKNLNAKKELDELSAKINETKILVNEAESLTKLFLDKDNAQTEFAKINSMDFEIKLTAEKLIKAQNALKISFLFEEYNKSSAEFNTRKSSKVQAEQHYISLKNQADTVKSELENLLKNEKAVKENEEKLISLKQLIPVYEELSNARIEAEKAEKDLNSAQAFMDKIKENESKMNSRITNLSAESDEIFINHVQKIPTLTARKNELSSAQSKVKMIHQLQSELNKLSAELSRFNNQIDTLEIKITEKKRIFDEAYNLQLENLTDLIAKSLKEGVPCPVCGSVEHPNIHHSERVQSEYNTKQLKNELDNLQSQRNSMVDEKNVLQSKIDAKLLSVSDINSDISIENFNENDLIKTASELQFAIQMNDKLNEINREKSELQTRLNNIILEKTVSEKKLYELQLNADKMKNRSASLISSLNPEIPDKIELENKILSLSSFIENYKNEYDRLSKKSNDILLELTSADTSLKQAVIEEKKSEEKYISANGSFNAGLKENNFIDINDFLANKITEVEINLFQTKISEYQNRKYAVEKQLNELNSQLENKVKPDLNLLHEQFSMQDSARQKASEELAVSENNEKRLSKVLKTYKEKSEKYAVNLENAVRFKEFSELLQGSRGISFTRYVLGVMLSLITTEANRLLRDVHGGQFQIYRKTDGTEKNRKTGLDLEVQSAMAVSKFSVKNLSGGEKFLISLAMSMALSAVLQSQSGGISIEAMFIDEGFGSLDQQSLHEAMDILSSIKGSRRTIGIISHVSELKEIITNRIDVKKDINGSHLKVTV